MERHVDKTKVDPLSAGEEPRAPKNYEEAAAKGGPVNATTAVIPGTGDIVWDEEGKPVKRVVHT